MPIPSLAALLAPEAAEAIAGGSGPDMTRYLLACTLIVGSIAGLGWIVQRFLASGMRARAARRSLRVVDVLPLGGKKRLAVVRCYERTFVLGVGEKEVSLVSELDADLVQAVESVDSRGEPSASGVGKFEEELAERLAEEPALAGTARPRTARASAVRPAAAGLGDTGVLG